MLRSGPFRHVLLLVLALLESGPAFSSASQESAVAPSSTGESAPGLLTHLDDAASPDGNDLEFYKRLYDFGLGKRAYSYVSEYKRLPVYNFGLGKRSGGKLYGFGLGKRGTDGRRMYSFGLGKRTSPMDEDDEYYYSEEDDEEPTNGEETLEDLEGYDKRDKLYSFGLGKRARPYSFGLGKRANPSMYSFGLGKRGGHSMYSFGLGKRADGRMYSFGLGKRPNEGRQASSRFNFGLGKRSDMENEYDDELFDEAKRSPDHRYAFGLGKREVTQTELDAVKSELREKQQRRHHHDESEGENGEKKEVGSEQKNDTSGNGKHAVKRSLHYGFGLGKRSNLYDVDAGSEEESNSIEEDFSRYARRPYSFGLGKRIPMYDFGIGKRSER